MKTLCVRSCRREGDYDNGCNPFTLQRVDKVTSNVCRSWLICREIILANNEDEQLGPEDVFSPMKQSEGLKMLVSPVMTGHDDRNLADGPIEMATWDVSRAHLQGETRNWTYTFYPEGYEQKGKLAGLRRNVNLERHMVNNLFKDCSMTIGTSCPAFFAVKMEIPQDFAIEMTSAGWHDGSSCKSSGISWKNCLRCTNGAHLFFCKKFK